MRELDWRGCYDKNLKGIISDESFSHPAKFAYGLICRIYAHLLERGWLQEGDLVADPFAGCGIGGIVAAANGLYWIGIELEQKFIGLTVGFDCDGIVERHQEEIWVEPQPSGWFVRLRIKAQYWDASGESRLGGPKREGWGTEQEAQAFADSIADSEEVQGYPLSILYWGPTEGHYATKWVCDKPAKCGNCEPHDPHHVTGSFELHKEQWEKMGKPLPIILQGDSRQFSSIIREAVDSIITSPPFLATEGGCNPRMGGTIDEAMMKRHSATHRRDQRYGVAEGQIGAMPPWVDTGANLGGVGDTPAMRQQIHDSHKRDRAYGQSEGQLGGMPEGDHDEAVGGIVTRLDNQSDMEYNYRGGVKDANENAVTEARNKADVRRGNDGRGDCEQAQSIIGAILRRLNEMGIARSHSESMKLGFRLGKIKPTRYWAGKKQPREMVEKRAAKTRGENHYLWKGGKERRGYRNKVKKEKCEICGARLNLGIHHKDFDHYNDAEENLQVLCVSCHMSLHKQAYWDAIKAGKEPPKSNGPVGWLRG